MTIQLTAGELAAWRDNPTTRKVLQFYRDQRNKLVEEWVSGAAMDPGAQYYAQILTEMSNPEFDDFAEFYNLKTEDDDEHDEEGS